MTNENEEKEKKFLGNKIGSSSKESDKTHKEKSKKQRTSSKDLVSSSATTGSNINQKVKDLKKESSTSTTISLTNNNNTGTTTLEIKSVKKEKTWDSEIKKSRNKEHKTNKEQLGEIDEIKSSKENLSKETKIRDKDKDRNHDIDKTKEKHRGKNLPNSPEDSSKNRYLKVPRDKLHTPASVRDPSCSPSSNLSGSYTPGGGNYMGAPSSASSINCNISGLMAEMEHESLPVSPLSSCDASSPLTFGDPSKVKDDSSDGEKDMSLDSMTNMNDYHSLNNSKGASKQSHDRYSSSVGYNNHKNAAMKPMMDDLDDHRSREHILSSPHGRQPHRGSHHDPEYIEQLKIIYDKINGTQDSDVLQKIVDIIEETGELYAVTDTAIDFDLMQLNKNTVKRIKLCLSKG